MNLPTRTITIYIANVPLSFISIILFGWASRWMVGGDPTFVVPPGILFTIFFLLYAVACSVFLNCAVQIKKGLVVETALVYFIVWYFLK